MRPAPVARVSRPLCGPIRFHTQARRDALRPQCMSTLIKNSPAQLSTSSTRYDDLHFTKSPSSLVSRPLQPRSCLLLVPRVSSLGNRRWTSSKPTGEPRESQSEEYARIPNYVKVGVPTDQIRSKPTTAAKRLLSKLPMGKSHENIYTIPNILTFTRLVAAPVVGYLLVHDYHAAALSLFAYAGITDLVDGWIARKYHLQTVVGTIIDPMADKLLMTIGVACLAVNGSLPSMCMIPCLVLHLT